MKHPKPEFRTIYENWDPRMQEYLQSPSKPIVIDESYKGKFPGHHLDIVSMGRGIKCEQPWNSDLQGRAPTDRLIYNRTIDLGSSYHEISCQDPRFKTLKRMRRVLWHDNRRAAQQRKAVHRKFAKRFELAEQIQDNVVDGKIWIQQWGRDCDMCEGTSSPTQIPASVYAFEKRQNEMYEWAEGPCSMWIVPKDELSEANASAGSRDLALEAFEDGHPHVVSRVRFDEEGSYA